MPEITLHDVYTYNDFDRIFWETHLESWVPRRIIDAHLHVVNPAYQIETVTEEMKREMWVKEMAIDQDAETAERCQSILYPNRELCNICFGNPSLGWEIEGGNADVQREAHRRGWRSLAVVRPSWVAEQVSSLLDQPGTIGVKPYYQLIGYNRLTRDQYLEASIFDYLPHHQLEMLNERGAWVTLHVPRAERLGDPKNIAEVKELRRRYPHVTLVIAHLGRSYTLPHAKEGLPPLTDDPGIYFDISAVMNPEVLFLAMNLLGHQRILYGTDNPVFYLRGREQWEGRLYIIRTNYPYYFNKVREAPEIEANYTIYTYEALKAIKGAADRMGYVPGEIDAMMYGNARRLIEKVEKSLRDTGKSE